MLSLFPGRRGKRIWSSASDPKIWYSIIAALSVLLATNLAGQEPVVAPDRLPSFQGVRVHLLDAEAPVLSGEVDAVRGDTLFLATPRYVAVPSDRIQRVEVARELPGTFFPEALYGAGAGFLVAWGVLSILYPGPRGEFNVHGAALFGPLPGLLAGGLIGLNRSSTEWTSVRIDWSARGTSAWPTGEIRLGVEVSLPR